MQCIKHGVQNVQNEYLKFELKLTNSSFMSFILRELLFITGTYC